MGQSRVTHAGQEEPSEEAKKKITGCPHVSPCKNHLGLCLDPLVVCLALMVPLELPKCPPPSPVFISYHCSDLGARSIAIFPCQFIETCRISLIKFVVYQV